MNEILLIDKPKGWTSFDVVAKVRSTLNTKYKIKNNQERIANSPKRIRVGHAGTLDPFATGLLIILVGDATKKQADFMKLDKEYEATMRLGQISSTGDPEGTIKNVLNSTCLPARQEFQIPKISQIRKTLDQFIGSIEQTPPAYSAIKVNGERAYKLARAGEKVEIKSREITIYELEVVNFEFPDLEIRVKCSSGTYIRTLAEDIGQVLGCGAYLTELRRTKIGEYTIKDALTVEAVIKSL